eukprot:751669-Rhodomonas_salina.1
MFTISPFSTDSVRLKAHGTYTSNMAWSWFGGKSDDAAQPNASPQGESNASSGCPIKHNRPAETASQCPVQPSAAGGAPPPMIFLDPRNNMRAGGESQHPGLGQSQALPTARKVSSIPRADHTPGHQENAGSNNWVYPSEQMFFNAMQRKGWNPSERDMSSVVAIHNAVNERTWSEVMKWEKMHCAVCTQPRLVKFHGRPTDYSPKARLYSLFGYKLPFDRHDWVIDRCGTP